MTAGWALWCDKPGCDTKLGSDVRHPILTDLRAAAEAAGWTRGNATTGDRCPAHAIPVHRPERLTQGRCRGCPATRALNVDGTVRRHRQLTPGGNLQTAYCPGGGRPPRGVSP